MREARQHLRLGSLAAIVHESVDAKGVFHDRIIGPYRNTHVLRSTA